MVGGSTRVGLLQPGIEGPNAVPEILDSLL